MVEKREMIRLSVVIPCFNAAATLGVQLDALARQQWDRPWEIVVADNGSTDESRKIVESYKDRLPNLRIVDASARRGQPYALNCGAAAAAGEGVAFCDADDEVASGWVAAMGEALLKYDFVACRIDFKKLNPPWAQAIFQGHAQQHGRLLRVKFPPYLWHAGGGTLGVKKALHEAVGGFDEALPYLHDTDFCFKLELRGVELHFVSDAIIHIRCRSSLKGLLRQALHWAEYSILLYKMYRPVDAKDFLLWKEFLWQWKELLRSIPQIRLDRTAQARWIWRLGWQLGRLVGSIKHHVPPV
jgi:glycosyltransferase involved in cell wall biosynthesis